MPFRQSSSGDEDLCPRVALLLTAFPVPTNRELSRSNCFKKKIITLNKKSAFSFNRYLFLVSSLFDRNPIRRNIAYIRGFSDC